MTTETLTAMQRSAPTAVEAHQRNAVAAGSSDHSELTHSACILPTRLCCLMLKKAVACRTLHTLRYALRLASKHISRSICSPRPRNVTSHPPSPIPLPLPFPSLLLPFTTSPSHKRQSSATHAWLEQIANNKGSSVCAFCRNVRRVLNTLAKVASCSADLRFADNIRASLEPQNRVEVLPGFHCLRPDTRNGRCSSSKKGESSCLVASPDLA